MSSQNHLFHTSRSSFTYCDYFVTVMTAPATDKFAGDGVMFRAKLFGTADVNEARGQYIHT